jgi:hypothetical protein
LKSGFIVDARRTATPNVVGCPGLSKEVIGDEKFERQYTEPGDGCRDRCNMGHKIKPIRDD